MVKIVPICQLFNHWLVRYQLLINRNYNFLTFCLLIPHAVVAAGCVRLRTCVLGDVCLGGWIGPELLRSFRLTLVYTVHRLRSTTSTFRAALGHDKIQSCQCCASITSINGFCWRSGCRHIIARADLQRAARSRCYKLYMYIVTVHVTY